MIRHRQRLLQLWAIAARYRLDTYLPNNNIPQLDPVVRAIKLHPNAWLREPSDNGIKHAFEEMGTLFLKLGQLLSTRRDLVPPELIAQLVLLQDKVSPFASEVAKQQIETAFHAPIGTLFNRFDEKPIAAASIAQVHTAALPDGREVVVKVVRPDIYQKIIADFELLRDMAAWLEARIEAARAIHICDIVEDYRQVLLNELDLTLEAANTMQMRANFLNSQLMYVPEVYQAHKNAMIAERIIGVPISDTASFDELNIDRKALAEKGLTIFFTQVFRDNFFHADMHPGNVYVETLNPHNPRYIALDCAIIGELSKADQLVVARLLLSVMNSNFTGLVHIVHQAGWIPPNTDQYALARDMTRSVSPMIAKPIDQIDFAGVLMQVLDIARRYHLDIPPQLMLLLKTLVHVEGLGRDLYPQLDIWSLAKPILTAWVGEQMNPSKNLNQLKKQLPELLLGATDLPQLFNNSLQSLSQQGARQDKLLREMQQLRADMLNNKRKDWLATAGFGIALAIGLPLSLATGWLVYLSTIFYVLAALLVLWRVLS